jgi:predicted alpha-1,6-mannanase (GH76 family)
MSSIIRWRRSILAGSLIVIILVTLVAIQQNTHRNIMYADTTIPDTMIQAEASQSMSVLQSYYDTSTGLWKSSGGTYWWQSANMLYATIDYMSRAGNTTYSSDITTTFNAHKSINFIMNYGNTHYYDDEAWWALAWIRAYDFTNNSTYLAMAQTIFNDLIGSWDSTCNGGIWWSTDRSYKNAITNELFLEVAARLHERISSDTTGGSGPNGHSYIDWATMEWNWFVNSGMINGSNMINDGLTSSCANNGGTTWTYNQGVVLGGLAELYHITGNSAYLSWAETLANASARLLTVGGILQESCDPSGDCGADGDNFKGIYIRNLATLYAIDHDGTHAAFIAKNETWLWANDRDGNNNFGLVWYGPFNSTNAARQCAGQELVNAMIGLDPVARPPAVAMNGSGALELFQVGSDGQLYRRWQTAAGGAWNSTNWVGLGGYWPTSVPVVGVDSTGQLQVFMRGTTGYIYVNTEASGWSGWTALDATFQALTDPVVGRNSDGRLEIFAVSAANGALYHFWQNSPGTGNWVANWSSLGGYWPTGNAAVALDGTGYLQVFMRGTTHNIYVMTERSGWGGWTNLNSGFLADGNPSVGLNAQGDLEVFAVSAGDKTLQRLSQTAAGSGNWGSWTSMGGYWPVGSAVPVKDGTGNLEVLMRGTTEYIYANTESSGWSGWTALTTNNNALGDPGVVANADKRLEAFVIGAGSDHYIWHNKQTTAGAGNWATGWDSLGGYWPS